MQSYTSIDGSAEVSKKALRDERDQEHWMKLFEQNTLRRNEMEKRKKKKNRENMELLLFQKEERGEKKRTQLSRLNDNKYADQKKKDAIMKKWGDAQNRSFSSQGMISMKEELMNKSEMAVRRQQKQQMNMQRMKQYQGEYKQMLAGSLVEKDIRSNMLI